MKRVLFLILLLIPLFVAAEDRYYGSNIIDMIDNFGEEVHYYSDNVVYENGMYRLTGNVVSTTMQTIYYSFDANIKEFYTCKSQTATECENVYVVYKDSTCTYTNGLWGSSITGYLGIMLRNGMKKEDVEYYYIGNDYKYENGKYTLVDYEKYDIKTIDRTNYLSRRYHKKYFCINNYGITCDNLYILNDVSDSLSYGTPVDEYYLISDNYIKENGKFKLVNPRRVWGAISGGEYGFTCKSKEDTCNDLYAVAIDSRFDRHDGGRLNSFTLLEVSGETKDIELKLNDSYDPLQYFSDNELDNVVNTDPSVADIKNKKLELYKAGETYFIVEDDFNYKALHLTVTEEDLPKEEKKTEDKQEEKKEEKKNPETRDITIGVFVLFIISLASIFVLSKKKIINN